MIIYFIAIVVILRGYEGFSARKTWPFMEIEGENQDGMPFRIFFKFKKGKGKIPNDNEPLKVIKSLPSLEALKQEKFQ